MKYFFVNGKFTNPIPVSGTELDSLVKKHLALLNKEVKKGRILFTAPKRDNSGIMFVMKGENLKEVEEFLKCDSLTQRDVQNYKIIEFNLRDADDNVKKWFD